MSANQIILPSWENFYDLACLSSKSKKLTQINHENIERIP